MDDIDLGEKDEHPDNQIEAQEGVYLNTSRSITNKNCTFDGDMAGVS
jgi:hypothetical protein